MTAAGSAAGAIELASIGGMALQVLEMARCEVPIVPGT